MEVRKDLHRLRGDKEKIQLNRTLDSTEGKDEFRTKRHLKSCVCKCILSIEV